MIEAVRPARPGEGVVLAALEYEARHIAAEHRGGPELLAEVAEAGQEVWEQRLGDPGWVVLLATIDDIAVGGLAGHLEADTLEIVGVWVDEGARELGLGDELLLAALATARTHGASVAEATALPGDRATKNLYERFGMKARKLVVSRRLDTDD